MVAMSGGLDSSMAAAILKQQGHEIIGVTLKTWKYPNILVYNSFEDDANDARNVAQYLGFPHYVISVEELFYNTVVQDFTANYLTGKTPNPCVVCNREIKFGKLIEIMQEFGCELLATGHYAKIAQENGRYFLQKSSDLVKDQTYFMWNLTQENLAKIMFPLSEFSKSELREKANELGLRRVAHKRESYNLCFLPNTDYRTFIQNEFSIKEGNFVLENGKIVGKHKGLAFYTIGQRRGLDFVHQKALFVYKFDTQKNEIILSEKEKLMTNEFFIENIHFQKYEKINSSIEVLIKVRHSNELFKGKLEIKKNQYKVISGTKIFAITSGQSAVFYEENDLIGGGFII